MHSGINSHAKAGTDLGKLFLIVYSRFGPSARRPNALQTPAAKASKEIVAGSGTVEAPSRDTLKVCPAVLGSCVEERAICTLSMLLKTELNAEVPVPAAP